MTPRQVREILGDGNFGGDYEKPDDVMRALWDTALAETRAMLEGEWRKDRVANEKTAENA